MGFLRKSAVCKGYKIEAPNFQMTTTPTFIHWILWFDMMSNTFNFRNGDNGSETLFSERPANDGTVWQFEEEPVLFSEGVWIAGFNGTADWTLYVGYSI